MQSSSSMPWLSFRKKPRSGQVRVFEAITPSTVKLNVKLPTGYGKTFTACGVYSILKQQGRVNRLLVIFPTVAQLDQFKKDGAQDLRDVKVDGPLLIDDISYFGAEAIKHHRNNTVQVFVTTIQALHAARGMDNCAKLMQTGVWMICVDEYHHYGVDKAWGQVVLSLSRAFLLAMSATPHRPNNDNAFGAPDISVSYRDAEREGAVKPLRGHAYQYKIDAIMDDGEVQTFTTSELVEEAGGEQPDLIEKLRIKRKMRWSPKYVSPLISHPIERMMVERRNGHKLQALVGAMCVSHASLVCKQITDMYPELRVDWVGTGDNGRPPEENRAVLAKFCPPKDENGNRPDPELDVLVHVGIAGEGLDTILVSEVIDLNNASLCNKRNQEHGRASRRLDGVVGHINFDSSSDYAAYTGSLIMDAMDDSPPSQDPTDGGNQEPGTDDPPPLPDEPKIQILNLLLLGIDSGDPGVQRLAEVLKGQSVSGIAYESLHDKDNPEWKKIIDLFKLMRAKESDAHNRESAIAQWQESVNEGVAAVAGRVIRMMVKNGARFDKSLAGDIKKRINTFKKAQCGAMAPDVELCRRHYQWVKKLEQQIVAEGLPSWLS